MTSLVGSFARFRLFVLFICVYECLKMGFRSICVYECLKMDFRSKSKHYIFICTVICHLTHSTEIVNNIMVSLKGF